MIVIRIDVWLIKGLKQNNIKTVYFVTGYSLFTVDTLTKKLYLLLKFRTRQVFH